jgi:hypothetical protein
MEKRDILNYLGEKVGEMEMPEGTSEDVWAEKLAPYLLPPQQNVPLPVQKVVFETIVKYQKIAPQLLTELYRDNTLMGLTVAGSDQMFDDYFDVLLRIREGAFPTAIYRLQHKAPSGFVTQTMIDNWILKIKSYM